MTISAADFRDIEIVEHPMPQLISTWGMPLRAMPSGGATGE